MSNFHRWTLAEIKEENTRTGGRFFSRENMKFAGDTMKSFTVCNETDSEGRLTGRVFVKRRIANKRNIPLTMWQFDPQTGRLRSVN